MDLRKNYYEEAKKSFLKDVTETVCKDQEDATVCISKNIKAFDSVFNALEEQFNMENKLLKDFEIRKKEGANSVREIPFLEKKYAY